MIPDIWYRVVSLEKKFQQGILSVMWQYTGNQRPKFAIEPKPGEESVWDYPRPPKLAPDQREVIVTLGGMLIAKTSSAIRVLETASPPTFYIPPADINFDVLKPALGNSYCEWKGAATYWSFATADRIEKHIGWSYDEPTKRFEAIKGFLSFYPAKVECVVDGQTVRPQPGGFYGGWVTDEIIGPYKGEPGTSGW